MTVQALLGHKKIDTTLTYARLYDGTVAADYYRAMGQIEQRLLLDDLPAPPPQTPSQLVVLLDGLASDGLTQPQRELVARLRAGLVALDGND